MDSKILSLLLSMLMVSMAAAGCLGGDDDDHDNDRRGKAAQTAPPQTTMPMQQWMTDVHLPSGNRMHGLRGQQLQLCRRGRRILQSQPDRMALLYARLCHRGKRGIQQRNCELRGGLSKLQPGCAVRPLRRPKATICNRSTGRLTLPACSSYRTTPWER